MKNLRLKLVILSMVLGLNFQFVEAQNVLHKELLSRPTDKSVTVQMFFDSDVEMSIDYGTSSVNYTSKVPFAKFLKGESAQLEIQGLMPNTKYYYRVSYKMPGASNPILRPEFSFSTQKSPGTSFSFVIQADPHLDEQSDTSVYKLCLKNQLEDNPDFMIDLGDILMSDKLRTPAKVVPRDTVTYRAHLMRRYYELVNHSVPLFITLGNHEGEAGWYLNGTANNVAVWGTIDRKKYLLNPEPNGFYSGDTVDFPFVGKRNAYYSWTWGDALFVVIDPYWNTKTKPDSLNGWRWSLGKVQYDWLKSTLENSQSKFKFIFAHQLVGGDPDGRGGVEFAERYEWGGNNLNGTRGFETNRPGWYKPIKDLLKENRVTVFFHGHDHFFAKQEKECLIYQETPQPSHPNFSSANQAKVYGYLEGQILPNSGHLRVKVEPTGVNVEYVRTYLPQNETSNRHNKDVSASYFIGEKNCYDSLSNASIPIIYNAQYEDEISYPNPFQKETTIKLKIRKQDTYSVNIHGVQGNQIRSLLSDAKLGKGQYQLIWDGTNNIGADVPSGVYFYQIKQQDKVLQSGKLILAR